MYSSLVVGTDGSETAKEAVRQAGQLAKALGARLHLVSAYEPVSETRLREERVQVPDDLQWMVNPREDVEGVLRAAADEIEADGVDVATYARATPPTRSSTSPRSRTPT
jgi:nucleotide-binding universal stress UspA family protein